MNKNDPEVLVALNNLYVIIEHYDPENVYNMDETGLFFRLLPRYTLLMPYVDVSSVRGEKKVKDRLSLVVCANCTGTHKVPCTLIGKPKSPACIKNREWPLKYISQEKAWMDVATCWKWFNDVFYPNVRRRPGRPVLLLMDNAPGHFEAFERDNVTVVFFPPNCTSWKQPCDLGIIAALKKRYKYLYLKDVLDFYELDESSKVCIKEQARRLPRGGAGVVYGNPTHLLDVAHYVKHAWDAISNTTILNAFKKAELMSMEDDSINEEENDFVATILHCFQGLNISIDRDELDNFVHVDDKTSEEYSQVILEDVDELLTTMRLEDNASTNIDNEESQDEGLPIENEVKFNGFKQYSQYGRSIVMWTNPS